VGSDVGPRPCGLSRDFVTGTAGGSGRCEVRVGECSRSPLCSSLVPARDHPVRSLALSPVHPQLARCGRVLGRVGRGDLRRGGLVVGARSPAGLCPELASEMASLRRDATPGRDDAHHPRQPHAPVASCWQRGEILGILAEANRNKAAALKLMSNLPKKQGYAPSIHSP